MLGSQCILEALETNPVPEKVKVIIDCPASLPAVSGDIDQLRIVFANLIRNAKEAMPNGGALSIHGTPTADGVEVAVTDTGVGIAPRGYPPDHGTAVLDQSARPRSWACYREVHPGEKQGKYAAYQRNRLGEHLYRSANRIAATFIGESAGLRRNRIGRS
jgi:hypothetical protein